MRRLNIALTTLLLSLIVGGIVPVRAQEQGVELPALAPFKTVRDTFIQTFNGRPLQVCQSEWESWNRVHGACRDLVTATTRDQELIAGILVEFVFYDGVHYQRVNDEVTWTANRDERYDPDLALADAFFKVNYAAVLTRIGPANIGNIPTIQYQYWSLDKSFNEKVGGQAVYDLFLSAENYVISDVFSARGNIPGLGNGTMAQTWIYSDFDAPIVIAPPAAGQVRAASVGMVSILDPSLSFGENFHIAQ
jgi:hypothetical protein